MWPWRATTPFKYFSVTIITYLEALKTLNLNMVNIDSFKKG